MVEAEDRLVDPVGALRLDQLLAAQRLQMAVDRRGRPGTSTARRRRRGRTAGRSPTRARRRRARRRRGARGARRAARGSSAASRRRRPRPRPSGRRRGAARRRRRASAPSRRRTAGCPRSLAARARRALAAGRPARAARRRACGSSAAPSGLELDHVERAPPARQRRAQLAQLGPRERDQQQRRVADPLGEVLDEVEERRLGPVDVVEHEHERPLARQRLEHPAHAQNVSSVDAAGTAPSTPSARSTTTARSSSVGQQRGRASRARCSVASPSSIAAAARSTSATGANVMPAVAWPRSGPRRTDGLAVDRARRARRRAASCRGPASR